MSSPLGKTPPAPVTTPPGRRKTIAARPGSVCFSGRTIEQRRFLGEGTYAAYPHCNGFVPGGEQLIVARRNAILEDSRLLRVNLNTFAVDTLPTLPSTLDDPVRADLYFDVALASPRIVVLSLRSAWVLDLDRGKTWRRIHTVPSGVKLQDLPSISPDGSRVMIGETRPDSHAAVEITVSTGRARTLFSQAWYANHFHYCPHDPSWIGFSHEGATESTLDRCWAWHEQLAPQGRCIFDQFAAATDPALPLNAGHERWTFHDASAHVVAYAVSPGGPRGLYEIFADGRPPRLLRETNTAWHCNMDATGRIVVIDTSAAWDPIPATGDEYADGVAAHLKADREKTASLSDIVLLDLATGEDLHIARVRRTRHPWHPHPALSPDAGWLIYNDADPTGDGAWLVRFAERRGTRHRSQ